MSYNEPAKRGMKNVIAQVRRNRKQAIEEARRRLGITRRAAAHLIDGTWTEKRAIKEGALK